MCKANWSFMLLLLSTATLRIVPQITLGQHAPDIIQETGTGSLRTALAPQGQVFAYGLSDGQVVVARHPLLQVGDLNCDGAVRFADINPFVLALTDATAYSIAFPECPSTNGDTNGDGGVIFADINPVVALLAG